ncbi:MAG: hypothetical protein NVSMB63_17770 [Sediminibacterium sp.]
MIDREPAVSIQTQEDLNRAIRQVKQRIKKREQDLEQRWNRLPEETIKTTVGAILPVFISNRVAAVAWKLIKVLTGLLNGKTGGKPGDWQERLRSSAKQLGFFGLLRLVLSFWRGR